MVFDRVYNHFVTTGTGVGFMNALAVLRAATFLVGVLLASVLGVGVDRTVHNERQHERHHEESFRRANRRHVRARNRT